MNPVGTVICPILVGRDDLLELADRRVEEAGTRTGRALLLVGEAGIGKSRLLGSIERRAAAAGFAIAHGAVAPRDLEVPGGLILDLARGMARTESLGPAGIALGERLRQDDASPGGDPRRRRRVLILDAVDILVEAATGPTVLSLEDLHWADDLSLEILGALARRLPNVPVLAVATSRSDELYPRVPMREWRNRLVAQRLVEEMRLGRLSLAETGTMVTLLLDNGLPAPRETVEAVQERTNGIPLHVEELLGAVRHGPSEAGDVAAAGVPDTIEGAVLERLDARSPEARELARAGSVIGRCFVLDVAARVLGRPPEQLGEPLDELVDHFFLVPAGPPGLYDFRHNLIRDAIYGRVPVTDRRRMHGRVAELGEGLEGAAEAFASAHFELAGRTAEAFEAALAGARAAAAVSSHREADQLYRRALRTIPADLPPSQHAAILAEFAVEAMATDDNAAAAAALELAEDRFREAGHKVRAAEVLVPLAAARHLLGAPLEERAALLRRGLDALADEPAQPGVERTRARLLAGLAAAHMLDRRLDASLDFALRAIEAAVAAGDLATELNAQTTLGAVFVFSGRMEEGWDALASSIARAREARIEPEAARAYRMIGSAASVLVEYQRGEGWLRDGIEYAERLQYWNDRHYMAAHLAHVLWATGRWVEAEGVAAHALADGRGGVTTRITALHVLGYIAAGRGELLRARQVLGEARELGERMHELQRLSPALWGLAELELQAGDAAAAADWCQLGRAASEDVDDAAYLFPFLVTGTRALLARGDPMAAQRWATAVGATVAGRAIPGTLPAVEHAAGLVLLAGGATGRARERLAAAVVGWTARGRAWEEGWARLDLASCLARANRPAEAILVLQQAARMADALGSPSLLDRASTLLRDARARHPESQPWDPLTAREFEVARLVATGGTNAEIAEELNVAPKTVSSHVEHILAKLGLARRAEIAAWASTLVDGNRRMPRRAQLAEQDRAAGRR